MNMDKVSENTKTIISNGFGFRWEEMYGDGSRDIKEVSIYETYELMNLDIPHTLLTLYDEILTEEERQFLTVLSDEDEAILDKENAEKYGEMVLSIVRRVVGNDKITNCIWLCDSKENIIESYVHPMMPEYHHVDEINFVEYIVPSENELCIISDLGPEGALIAYANIPIYYHSW